MQQYRVRSSVIRQTLRQKRLSQNALARQLGMNSGYLSQLLCGHRCPGRKTRLHMLEAPFLRDHSFKDLFEPIYPSQRGAK